MYSKIKVFSNHCNANGKISTDWTQPRTVSATIVHDALFCIFASHEPCFALTFCFLALGLLSKNFALQVFHARVFQLLRRLSTGHPVRTVKEPVGAGALILDAF